MYERYEILRNKKNISDFEVGKKTGIPRSVLSTWKNGKSNPDIKTLSKLADFFGVSVDYLIGRE